MRGEGRNGLGWNIAEPGPKLDYLVTRIRAAVSFVIRRSSARGNHGFAKKAHNFPQLPKRELAVRSATVAIGRR